METISSTLKLNYDLGRFTYNFNWDIPYMPNNINTLLRGGGQNFLIKCSKLTGKNIFRSGKIECTSGPLQGLGKYLEYFLLVKDQGSKLDVSARMSCAQNDLQNEDRETIELVKVSGQFFNSGYNKVILPIQFLFFTKAHEGTIQIPESFATYPEDTNSCVKWMRCLNSSNIPCSRMTRFELSAEVQFEKWRKAPGLNLTQHYTAESNTLSQYGQLNTNALLFCPNWSDVTIYCGERTFPAHVLILQSKNSVFHAMFSQSMTENLTRKLKIEDAEPEVVEEFVRYIYTGTVTNMAKNSVGLFVIAEKYNVQTLRSLCENFVLANISDDNALERYNLGKLLNSKAITSKCIEHIRKNRKTIWKTEEEFYEGSQKFKKLFCELFYK